MYHIWTGFSALPRRRSRVECKRIEEADRCPNAKTVSAMIDSTIHEKVRAYCTDNMSDRHGSEYSWVQCYGHFHKFVLRPHEEDPDHAALHLGFYLASRGMFRNSFLGSRTYTVHLGAIDQLVAPRFSALWKPELGIDDNDSTL